MIRKFIFATLNVDEDILKELNSQKEYNIIYGSFVRLFLSTAVVFGITLFACYNVPALAGLYAWLVALVVAMIIFWLDSAIIGSEWDHPQSDKFFLKIKRLLPRIVFSAIIAFFIAGIAELAIQKSAIDQELIKIAKKHNDDSGNTKLREEEEKRFDAEIDSLKDEKTAIKESINARNTSALGTMQSERDRLKIDENKNKEILNFLYEILGYKNSAALEIIPNEGRCSVSSTENIEKCKGPRYRDFINKQIETEKKLTEINYPVDSKIVEAQIAEQEKLLLDIMKKIATIDKAVGNVSKKSLDELEDDLVKIEGKIKTKEGEKKTKLIDFDEEQKKLGDYIDPNDYDFLLLYLGLDKLYKDEEKGFPAKKFSWGLFSFIVLMELSSVIAAMFFLPYSIYASKAFIKVRQRQVEEAEEMTELKKMQDMDSLMSSGLERNIDKIAKAMNKGELDGEPNPTPPPQKE